MTEPTQANQTTVNQNTENKPTDKELNFRALEAKYQRQLEQERAARLEAERVAQEAVNKKQQHQEDEENDDEPYVDHKKLKKTLSSFERNLEEKIEKKAEEKARYLLDKEKRESWIRNNPDFYEVLQNAEKFAQKDPDLAETILEMPDTFERQKLVYKNIKALGLHKPEVKQPTIQDKIDANRKSPYYQPTGVGTAPYGQNGDFSSTGQKQAYEKMQQLKKQLRI
jgi:hypothetical protein